MSPIDFLEQILHGDEPGGAAVLIHHHRHLRAVAAHRGEHLVDRRRSGHVGQFAGIASGDRLIRDQVPQHFLDVQAADDVIEVAAVDRITRVGLRADDGAELVGLGAHRYADEQHARDHRLAGGSIAELEQVAEQLA